MSRLGGSVGSNHQAYLGCAGNKQWVPTPHGQAANVLWVETIDVLFNADGIEDAALIDVLGKGQLDEDSVDLGVAVVCLDDLSRE